MAVKLLIIEGTDRCGKNTLIENLIPYCQNTIITHFSTPEGVTDTEKKLFQQTSFEEEFKKAEFFLNSKLFKTPKKDKMNLFIWNRAHLGEFVYGKLYRETNPEEWVMNLEESYGFDVNENVYLLLLTASPEFLAKHDDGLSFDSSIEARKMELINFRNAFQESKIVKKLELQVEKNGYYRDEKEITEQVLKFIKT